MRKPRSLIRDIVKNMTQAIGRSNQGNISQLIQFMENLLREQDQETSAKLDSVINALVKLNRKVTILMTQSNATQADIDALAAQVTTDDQAIAAAVLALNAEIAALQAANPGLNVAGLTAAVAQLTADVPATPPAV